MKLAEMYAKDINRTIDGVIKASEDEHVRLEVEEYVFTAEIKNGLSRILEQYTSPHPKSNGVWISGFFGSGKSHLLKMTSFLLGDVQGVFVCEPGFCGRTVFAESLPGCLLAGFAEEGGGDPGHVPAVQY
ncbi:hypothetical protein QP139_04440 [Winkia sp. UMB10116]|uniref:hypothetical protein n=1 Tax=Winkia sp. UMB10116 TaxID=3046355 RepID=UPI002553E849|nr:hypothetical protein [Winkia sp. UMB10116]MDK6240744.1 hypothetical protein [Winkia sp. UMB10116]